MNKNTGIAVVYYVCLATVFFMLPSSKYETQFKLNQTFEFGKIECKTNAENTLWIQVKQWIRK